MKVHTSVKSGKRRRYVTGEVEVCCHRVSFWYEIYFCRITDTDLQWLEEHAEERAKECIIQGYREGELNASTPTPVRQRDREFRGWWRINWD